MKRLLSVFIVAILFLLAACKADEPSVAPVDIGASPTPSLADGAEPGDVPTAAAYGKNPAVRVDAAVASVFDGAEGITLYGAAAYTNTGDCPITIEKAAFTFTAGGASIEHSFAPVLGEYAVLLPGETSFLTAWVPQGAASALTAGAEAALSVSLTPQKAEPVRTRIVADNLYLADNYPGFTTLSGRITCEGALGCGMNILHVGFYDENETFLGAWYFTKNTLLEGNESKNFVVQMHGLPLPSLAERAASVRAIGFGFTL